MDTIVTMAATEALLKVRIACMQIKELPKMEVLQQCPYRRGKWIKCAPAIATCLSPRMA